MSLRPEQLDTFYASCCPWMEGDLSSVKDRVRFLSLSAFLTSVCSSHDATGLYPYATIVRAAEQEFPVDVYDTRDGFALAAKAIGVDVQQVGHRPSHDSVYLVVEHQGHVWFAGWCASLEKSFVYRLADLGCRKEMKHGLSGVTLTDKEFQLLREGSRADA